MSGSRAGARLSAAQETKPLRTQTDAKQKSLCEHRLPRAARRRGLAAGRFICIMAHMFPSDSVLQSGSRPRSALAPRRFRRPTVPASPAVLRWPSIMSPASSIAQTPAAPQTQSSSAAQDDPLRFRDADGDGHRAEGAGRQAEDPGQRHRGLAGRRSRTPASTSSARRPSTRRIPTSRSGRRGS